jgi:hypothetical protein
MRKHHVQVQYVIESRNPELKVKGSVIATTADNTRWDIVQAAIIKLMQETNIALPTNMMSWVLNGNPQHVIFSSINTTVVFKLPLEQIRYLKSTDIQVALGKYSITQEGYL